MASLDFNKIKRWVFFILSAWALLAFIAWHYESTCGMFLSGACWAQYWDTVRCVVLLKWVKEYQTLVAGVLTLGGACFVLLAAKFTVAKSIEAENRKQRTSASIACSIVSSEFRDQIKELQARSNTTISRKTEAKTPFPQSYIYLPTLCAISPQLGPIVAARMRDLVDALHSPENKDIAKEIAYSEVVFYILDEIQNLLENDGTYDMNSGPKLPSNHVKSALADIGWSLENVVGLRSFFELGIGRF